MLRTAGYPGDVLLWHKIACGTYLHMQRAGKGIDNLTLFMCMARQFNFFPSGFLDADGLLTRLLYQRKADPQPAEPDSFGTQTSHQSDSYQ